MDRDVRRIGVMFGGSGAGMRATPPGSAAEPNVEGCTRPETHDLIAWTAPEWNDGRVSWAGSSRSFCMRNIVDADDRSDEQELDNKEISRVWFSYT